MRTIEKFLLPEAFLDSMPPDEVEATFEALVECSLDRAPFAELVIAVPFDSAISIVGEAALADQASKRMAGTLIEFHYNGLALNLSHSGAIFADRADHYIGKSRVDYLETLQTLATEQQDAAPRMRATRDSLLELSSGLLKLLVTALASKCVEKKRVVDKLARLGIGVRRRELIYTTTLSVGHICAPATENETEGGHSGRTVRPHLRRGHIRRQHHGPNNEFIKKVFIEAVFVNSDREFVSFRDHYSVSFQV